MPVFNGACTLVRAIRSLQDQTYQDWSLVICDNSSTDATPQLCETLCAEDSRIKYLRQRRNIGAPANFATAFSMSCGEYFMWAAHDDQWRPTFIEANVAALDENHELIASVSRVAYLGSNDPLEPGTFPLNASPGINRRSFLRKPGMNSRIYGIYRRSVLELCVNHETFWAFDWAIVMRALKYGKFGEVPYTLLLRSSHGESSRWLEALPRYESSMATRLVPLATFTRRMLRISEVRRDPWLLALLASWNIRFIGAVLYSVLTRPAWTVSMLTQSSEATSQ